MKRHLPLVILRMLMAYAMAQALPYAHVNWGEDYPGGDGQKAFGMLMIFYLIGLAFALAYFVSGSIIQYFLRRKPALRTLGWDGAAFLILSSLLAYGGITAHYGDADSPMHNEQAVKMAPRMK